ncbi:MAG TPA: ATP-binding cassette domain-containing protein [Mycobacteriales bacterium]
MSALLVGESVCKYFGGLKAVDDVSFTLDDGEILGLIGPNGAGKTTLFSVAAGSVPATRGRVLLDGKQVSGRAGHRSVHQGICRTHQIVRPFAKLSILDNVLVGHHYGRPPGGHVNPRDHAMEILDFIGLADRADQLPGELTLAGRKRLEVARALATGPRVLLLDEVVAGLTPVEATRFVELIRRIRDRGTSIIMIEHVMHAVMGVSDRVMVLDHGRLIAEGRPQEVVHNPLVIEAYLGREDEPTPGESEASTATVAVPEAPADGSTPAAVVTPVVIPAVAASSGDAPRSDSMLQVRDIDVFYGDAQALYGIGLHVDAGEVVTLVGSNGAGKTTTLRAISGLRPISRGDILFEGSSISSQPAHARADLGIALVPEGRELWPSLTVLENLELGCYSRSARKHRGESLERVFDLFPRLKERTSQVAGSMSGGEQQMVAIARALMTRPRLLMFDEPSLGLAPVIVTQVFDIIRKLSEQGLTILLVEQNLQKALETADRGYVMETGSITLKGPATELMSNEGVRSAYLGI